MHKCRFQLQKAELESTMTIFLLLWHYKYICIFLTQWKYKHYNKNYRRVLSCSETRLEGWGEKEPGGSSSAVQASTYFCVARQCHNRKVNISVCTPSFFFL